MSLKLTIELVPYDSFEKNLRHVLSKHDWDVLRKDAYKRANYQCSICCKQNITLSAHEEWNYIVKNKEKKTGVQKLTNILALCFHCHMIKHIAFADELARQGKLNMKELLEHFFEVNQCSEDEFIKHYNDSIIKWNEQADIKFKLHIKWIEKLHLNLKSYPLNYPHLR